MADFCRDTFTDTPGTLLTAHVGEVGASWVALTGTSGAAWIEASGVGCYLDAPGLYAASGIPPSADYSVFANLEFKGGAGPPSAFLVARCDPATTLRYGAGYFSGAWTIFKDGGAIATGPAVTPAVGTYALEFRLAGSSLLLFVDGVQVAAATDATYTAAGSVGIRNNAGSTESTFWHFHDFRGSPTPSLVAGTVTLTSYSASGVSLAATAPTGSTGAVTYQWYRSPTRDFAPPGGTALAGATGLTLADTPPDRSLYWYSCRQADAGASVVTNTQAARRKAGPIRIGFTGSSSLITNTSGGTEVSVDACVRHLSTLADERDVAAVNQGIGGTQSVDWVSGSADLVAAMAAFAAAGVTHVGILIGVNDGRVDVPVATWKANVLSQAAALVAAGYKVLLLGFQCPWVPATVTPAEADLIRQYVLQYPSMADGVNVLAATGSLEVYDATALAPTALIGDGLHPNTAGVDFYGRQWALAFYQALYGTGTGGFATIGCGFIRGD